LSSRIIGGDEMTFRDDAYLGQFLRVYEKMRYTPVERTAVPSIIVPPDAEEFADVSFWQAGMDWNTYATHARAVILRIGQNVWKDIEFETNYAAAHSVGLLVGGYFFFDGRATPEKQAGVIIAAMQGKYFEMELFIDFEHNYGGQYEGLPNVVKLMQLVEAAGVKCKAVGLYSGYYWFTGNSNASANAAQYTYLKQRDLWLAWYASASIVRVPAPWTNWTHWQYGTPVVSWGQPTQELDLNRHNGTREQFAARYIVGEIFPPEDGEPMAYFKVNAAELNTRSTGVYVADGSNVIGKLLRDDIVQADEPVNGWRRIRAIYRNNAAVVLPTSPTGQVWASGSYLVATTFTPPPAETLPNVVVTVSIPGYQTLDGKPSLTVEMRPV
jgi:GH25 family lysozyme M1 (1,4-beta-N-acetylmuramidase)